LWLKRAALMVFSPLLVFLLLEGILRLVGYGYPTSFFIPSRDAGRLITNERFACQFFSRSTVLKPYLFTLEAKKPAGTIRICVLGESAAMGTPDPAFGFGRILEIALRRNFPDHQFEVINAAMRGIDSHIIRLIAQECVRHEIDYFVVYMGNNEVVGFDAPGPNSSRWTHSLTWIRATEWLRATRLGQWLVESLGSSLRPSLVERDPQDMDFFRKQRLRADDWRRDLIADNFRDNLQAICRAITTVGSKLTLATMPVNLQDCPPLSSLHRGDLTARDQARWDQTFQEGNRLEDQKRFPEAAAAYESAAQIDDHFAELHFRLGRCYLASGDAARARRHYELARDWDTLQFRSDARINQIIRSVGARWQGQGVQLVDVERAFADSPLSDRGLPGAQLFNDHVHPTFAGTYLLAQTVYAQLAPALEQSLGREPRGPIPTFEECLQAVPYTLYDDLNVVSAMVQLTARPPFLDQVDHFQRQLAAEAKIQARLAAFSAPDAQACLKTYKAVINLEPDYWPPRFNLASMCEELGQYPAAFEQLRYLIHEYPGCSSFSAKLAEGLFKSGNKKGAVTELREAFKRNPTDKALEAALRQLEHSN
jgi:tetratricopeptide (TPR) repeat protein